LRNAQAGRPLRTTKGETPNGSNSLSVSGSYRGGKTTMQNNSTPSSQLGLFPSRAKPSEPHAPVFGRRGAPLAATADPESSKHAAAEIDANGGRQRRKAAVLAALRTQPEPVTSLELSEASGLCRFACARALPDLAHDGIVQRCPMRVCRAAGRLCITWGAR